MQNNYDVIIIGGGPNGLTAGCYLSKAGQKVLLLEKRIELGGGLATEQITLPDFYHNTHAIYHLMVDYAPPVKDFELEAKYGLKFIRPELQFAMPLPDGRSLCIYTDVEKTCKSIAQFSKKDADSYRDMSKRFFNIANDFIGPATYCPPMPPLEQTIQLEESGGEVGKEINKYVEMTPEEIINEHFENDLVRTMMLYIACHWGLDYDGSGASFMVPLLINRGTNYRLCQGGSHRLSNAITKFMLEYGGEILTNAQIKRIIMQGDTAKGVELENGTKYMANKAIISTLDPHQTFLKLVGEDNLKGDLAETVKAYEWEHWSLCHLHLALEEPPRFKAAEKNPDVNKAFVYVIGYESTKELKKHWDDMREGKLSDPPAFNCCFPSVHDPYQAPPGKCSGLISQMAPYDLNGDKNKWLRLKFKDECAEKQLAVLRKYAPNLTKDKVMWWNMTTPADIENKFANMVHGSIKQGAYVILQMGYLRPNEECSSNKTPFKNLYLGGASSYPGGLVTFGPGVCVADRVAKDCGIKKWWPVPECVAAARAKGMPL